MGGSIHRNASGEKLMLKEGGNSVSHIGGVADEEVATGRIDDQLGTWNACRCIFGGGLRVEEIVRNGED